MKRRLRLAVTCAALVLCQLSSGFAPSRVAFAAAPEVAAEGAAPDPAEEPIEADPVATAVAIVPGVLLHGSGHFAAGKKETALRLLLLEGIGVGLVLLGGATLALTGAARDVVGPAAAVTIGGVGLFGISFAADVYGVAIPGEWRGAAPRKVYSTTRLGVAHVYDPQFDYRWFLTAGFERWLGPVRLAPSGWFGLDEQNERLRLLASQRFFGSRPGWQAPDGSSLDLTLGITRHDFGPERFTTTNIEGSVDGRLDLHHIGPSLRGSFAEMGTGWAISRTGYEVRGLDSELIEPDFTEVLLFRMGFGSYFRQDRGEWRVYYDHRHDAFAAGLLINGLGSGVAGHFGFDLAYFPKSRLLSDQVGLGVDAQVGAARILGLSLLFREAM